MTPRHLGLLAVVLALLAASVLAGCGGDEESASEQWAGDVCSELSTWATGVEEAIRSLTAEGLSLDEAAVQSAVDQAKESTDDLVDGLRDLGRPEAEAGEQARSELDELGAQLREQLDEVEAAAEAGSLSLPTVTAALAAAASSVTSTLESLRSLNADEELRDAFDDAESCESLREQAETTGD